MHLVPEKNDLTQNQNGSKKCKFLMQYKLKESPIPSDEEESSEESSDDEFGPKKPKVDPDDPVARKSSQKKSLKILKKEKY